MQIIPVNSPSLTPGMQSYVDSIPVADEPTTPEEEAALLEARAEKGPGISSEELGVRLGVYRALEAHEGGSWLAFQLVDHLAQAGDIPLGWGTAQLVPILDRMVKDQALASTVVNGAAHYHLFGTIYGA